MGVSNSQKKNTFIIGELQQIFILNDRKNCISIIYESKDIAIQSDKFFESDGLNLGTLLGNSYSYDFFFREIYFTLKDLSYRKHQTLET